MADFLHDGFQLGNGHHLCNIIQNALAVLKRLAAPGTIVGRYVHPLIRLVRHLQRAAIVSLLPTWLTARWLAQCLGAADGLSFYGFLRGRSVAVAGVLPRPLVFGKFLAKLLVFFPQVANLLVQSLCITVEITDFRMLRVNSLAH